LPFFPIGNLDTKSMIMFFLSHSGIKSNCNGPTGF